MSEASLSAGQVITLLGLVPHPEGGHFKETFRHEGESGERGACTLIYYLLAAGEWSAWHRIDAVEIWHWYAGAPLTLGIAADGRAPQTLRLGGDLAAGFRPQAVVPAGAWQMAETEGPWTLVGCTVAPAFRFEGFELAEAGWHPDGNG